jgi:hypothetical protein
VNHHERVLQHLFAHPVSMNLKWSEIAHLIEHHGGSIEHGHGARAKVRLGGQEYTFHVPNSGTIDSKDEVVQIRRLFERAGLDPGVKHT